MKLLLVCCLLLSGCYMAQPHKLDQRDNSRVLTNITYIKDVRTEICYAVLGSDSYGSHIEISITAVPCEKVQEELK